MILALLLSLTQAPVTVQLNHEQFSRGDRARVYVEAEQDGHLVVLHADPDGRVRVLFPLDPSDDDFVRGGRRQELRGRSGRDAFVVDGEDGSGTVLAAIARDEFSYDAFVRNDHWDYRALGGASLRDDPLAGLLDIVQRMAGGDSGATRFEYDAATYVVDYGRHVGSRYGYGSRFGIGLSFGHPYRYSYFRDPFYDPFYDPYCYDAFWGWSSGCNRFGYRYGYGYGSGYGYGYSYYRPRPYPYAWGGSGFASRGGSRFVMPRNGVRDRYTPVEPRPRATSRDATRVRERSGVSPRTRAEPRTRSGGGSVKPAPKPRSGSSGGSRPSVSRGSSGGSRPAPATRPSNGGTRRRN